jgi:hypothetical protein
MRRMRLVPGSRILSTSASVRPHRLHVGGLGSVVGSHIKTVHSAEFAKEVPTVAVGRVPSALAGKLYVYNPEFTYARRSSPCNPEFSNTSVKVAKNRLWNYRKRMKLVILVLSLAFGCWPTIARAESPAAAISTFRVQQGEGRVVSDSTLTRIAQDQANAMASKGLMDHDVLGSFGSRVSPANAGRAAENIAYGYDSFAKTLDQWINSSGHRKNLLMHDATRVGVASAKSSANGRTYWAMVIAGDYERPKSTKGARQAVVAKPKVRINEACRLKILSICF